MSLDELEREMRGLGARSGSGRAAPGQSGLVTVATAKIPHYKPSATPPPTEKPAAAAAAPSAKAPAQRMVLYCLYLLVLT